ncbi:hypothetical protein KGF57_002831 [Candida theae]|uniref:Uncharacterized protein n=1 Tax=Candida theae TaxID=1198502 RepID=A0AAD5FYM1_9ASCO|nr:uncharacterized protein KGF57_002831 [Candida theae]KAI5958023.1 hypothetical protein KGF57_002831 [Candida theae]
MSKLDQILAFAQEIESRSNKLADATSASIDLINHISYINQQLLNHDHDIGEIRHLMDNNQSCLVHLNALNERTFYLQSNLPINDYITNQTSFENLNTEYNYILSKLASNNQIQEDDKEEAEHENGGEIEPDSSQLNIDDSYIDGDSYEEEEDTEEDHDFETEDYIHHNETHSVSPTLEPPNLKKMISISNLQLKPMRCASSSTAAPTFPNTITTLSQPRSIQNKKSRYRLSSIYNINPVALDDNDCINYSNTTSSLASASSSSPPSEDSDRMMKNSLSESVETIESQFSTHMSLNKHNELQNDMTTTGDDDNDTKESDLTILPDQINAAASVPGLHKHARSNSLPTTSSIKSIDQIDLFKELDYSEDYLRFNRLKHFISISNLSKRSTKYGTAETEEDDILFYQEFEKSLTPQQYFDNCDVSSVISDISYYSPEKQQDETHDEVQERKDDTTGGDTTNLDFDTYSSFLRKSKLNLNEAYHDAFPHLFKQHSGHNKPTEAREEQQDQTQDDHTPYRHSSHNFKNPIATVGSTIPHTVGPTLDTTFEQQYPVSASHSNDKLSSRKLLTQVIAKNPALVNRDSFTMTTTPPTSPKQNSSFLTPASSPPLSIPIRGNKSFSASSLSSSSSKLGSVVSKSSPSIATSPSLSTSSSASSPSFTHNLINFMTISKLHREKQKHQVQRQRQHHHQHQHEQQQRHFHPQYLLDNPFSPHSLIIPTKPPTPEKIRQLKKQKRLQRHIPISIPNEAQLKRVPVHPCAKAGGRRHSNSNIFRNDGAKSNSGSSFAKLTILRNEKHFNNPHARTNHPDSVSIEKSPIMRDCNRDAIREALSASLLE